MVTNPCGIDTTCIGLQTDGLTNISYSNDLSIFPNPSNKTIFVTSSAVFPKGELTIINSIGKTILTEKLDHSVGNQLRLEVEGLSQGLYYLMLTTDTGIELISKKILIIRP
ncbi:MAG: T9SS type A sorting domain-containing protein [Bacteroidetes bacterium]|nr:T9SS type A sorting domain-containing protein [Bacteroidota bacterium]